MKQTMTTYAVQQLDALVRQAAAKNLYNQIAAKINMKNPNGKQVPVASVKRWLHPDPAQRTQPLFETGLLLIEVGREIKEGK